MPGDRESCQGKEKQKEYYDRSVLENPKTFNVKKLQDGKERVIVDLPKNLKRILKRRYAKKVSTVAGVTCTTPPAAKGAGASAPVEFKAGDTVYRKGKQVAIVSVDHNTSPPHYVVKALDHRGIHGHEVDTEARYLSKTPQTTRRLATTVLLPAPTCTDSAMSPTILYTGLASVGFVLGGFLIYRCLRRARQPKRDSFGFLPDSRRDSLTQAEKMV